MDAQGRTAFQLQDEIKSIGISHELAYLLCFYYFLYCDLIEYQSIRNQKAPLLRITPAVENITFNVHAFNSNTCTIKGHQRISLLTSYLKFIQNLVNSYSLNIPIHCMCFIFVQGCTKFYK